jgi:spore photoproduct lyase
VMAHGWKVRICIDPILHIPDWRIAYRNLFVQMQQHFDMAKIDSFSIGVFRMNHDFLKRIRQQRSDTAVLFGNFEKQDEVATYKSETKKKLLNELESLINEFAGNVKVEMI